VVVGDHRVEAVHRVHHAGSEVDEPDERRASSLEFRDHGLVELLDERHFVADPRPVEGLRSNCASRDSVCVDVRDDADERARAETLRDFLGHRLHRGNNRAVAL
jgi:hypothetical protein